MILDSTSKSIQIILAGAVTANQLPCVTSWADITTTTFTPGSTDTQSNNTTAVTIVAAPAASTQRQVKNINIYNSDTANATITVELNNSSTLRKLVAVLLPPGQTLQYSENAWSVIDSNGNIQSSAQINAAGAQGDIQYNADGQSLGGDSDFSWTDSTQTLALSGTLPSIQLTGSTSSPAAPPTGNVAMFGRSVANRQMLDIVGPSGLSTTLQPILARNKVGYWNPQGNNVALPGVFGFTAPTATTNSTVTARNVATTSIATRMRRLGYVTPATAGDLAGHFVAAAQFSCGSGSNDGSGFFLVVRWVPSDAATITGERTFIGMSSSVAQPTNVEPSTLTNAIGIAQISTDATQLYLIAAGSSAQSATALGTNFPGSQLSTTAYELAIFAPNSVANTYYWQLTNVTSGNLTTGTATGTAVQVPQSTTLLAYRAWSCNNATALATGIDICSVYIETDN